MLAKSLQNSHYLTYLNLEDNLISDIGVIAITRYILKNNQLHTLILEKNDICNLGTEAISQTLKINRSLTELNLAKNNINSYGIKLLINSLQYNRVIRSIEFYDNDLKPHQYISHEKIVRKYLKINTIATQKSLLKLNQILTKILKYIKLNKDIPKELSKITYPKEITIYFRYHNDAEVIKEFQKINYTKNKLKSDLITWWNCTALQKLGICKTKYPNTLKSIGCMQIIFSYIDGISDCKKKIESTILPNTIHITGYESTIFKQTAQENKNSQVNNEYTNSTIQSNTNSCNATNHKLEETNNNELRREKTQPSTNKFSNDKKASMGNGPIMYDTSYKKTHSNKELQLKSVEKEDIQVSSPTADHVWNSIFLYCKKVMIEASSLFHKVVMNQDLSDKELLLYKLATKEKGHFSMQEKLQQPLDYLSKVSSGSFLYEQYHKRYEEHYSDYDKVSEQLYHNCIEEYSSTELLMG